MKQTIEKIDGITREEFLKKQSSTPTEKQIIYFTNMKSVICESYTASRNVEFLKKLETQPKTKSEMSEIIGQMKSMIAYIASNEECDE